MTYRKDRLMRTGRVKQSAARCCWTCLALVGLWSQASGFDLESERREMLDRERRVIFNNDGAEVFLFPADKEITPENVLEMRTTALAGSHVDAIFYNPSSPSFGLVTHYTEVLGMRDYYELRHQREGRVNATWALIEQGSDSLQLMIDFARDNEMELFLSKRMNDTHDAGRHRPGSPNPTFAPLKRRHPEYLVGSYNDRPPYGRWSAVDYSRREVRDLAYDYLEEVCRNYDIDGIELDFFRHVQLFGSVLRGEHASREELEMMTGLIRKIRTMTEREGEKRGRPILLAVRVPDSVEYSRAIGIDIETWLSEGLVDILIGSGYFRLNHWEYLVDLGHRYGAKVYPGLSESRLTGTDVPPFSRGRYDDEAQKSYRARASQAWAAGVDGIYLFNFFDADSAMLRELGEPDVLASLDKTYFVTVRNRSGAPSRWVAGGDSFFNVPVLSPQDPLRLVSGKIEEIELRIGDDLGNAVRNGLNPEVSCYVRGEFVDGLAVTLNGVELSEGVEEGPWLRFGVPPDHVRQGPNRIGLTPLGEPGSTAWLPQDNAVFLNGEDYLAVTDLPELNSTTWSIWIKPAERSRYMSIINADFDRAAAGHLLDLYQGRPRVVWNHGGERSDLQSSDALPLGEWTHIAITLDATRNQLDLYVNGERRDSARSVSTSAFHTMNMGRRFTSDPHAFHGSMRDVRIYNRALAETDVWALYRGESTDSRRRIPGRGVVAHWPFDDGSGRIARDASENNNHATVYSTSAVISDLVVTIGFPE